MPNDFQVNFLNGLEMARSTQGAKLDAMQQAASMQYQISAKQMDFQMGLLKLRESQAAQAVEMRMAQDEHQLKLKDYALRAKESELRASQLSQEMETKNVAMHAGAAISDLENRLVLQGLDPSSPEYLLAQVSSVQQGAFANTDPKIANVIGSTLTAKLRTTQEGFYNSGLEALEKVNASRQVSLGNEETGVTLTDRMLGAGDKAKLIAVADRFKRGAILGHEPSQRMYGEVMGLIDGVTAPAPGVQPAASAAAGVESKYAMPLAQPGGVPGRTTRESVVRGFRESDVVEAKQYIETARTKLNAAKEQYRQQRDVDSIMRIEDQLSKLSDLQSAAVDESGQVQQNVLLPYPGSAPTSTGMMYQPGPLTRTQVTRSPTKMDLWNLSKMQSPEDIVNEIDAIMGRRQPSLRY